MTSFEKLYAIATGPGPVVETARKMIGEDQLALMIAKAAVSETTEKLSPTQVGEVLDISKSTALERIENVGFLKVVNN